MLEKLMGDASTGIEITELGKALEGLNWKEATPDTLIQKLDELGISTSMTTTELDALIGLMTDGVVKISNIGKDYASLT
jgi:hypothetical protein